MHFVARAAIDVGDSIAPTFYSATALTVHPRINIAA
jgi:hypothetical protein